MVSAVSTVRRTAARRDLALIVVLPVIVAIVCLKFNLSEMLFASTRRLERFQLDELPLILLVIALCLIWFSWRRYAEASRALALRNSTEVELAAALTLNRRLTQRYVETQESDSKALARDLHDELGQYLNAIKIDAVSIRQQSTNDQSAFRDAASGMIQNIDHVLNVITGLIRQLRPVALDELGLAAALEQCVSDWRRRLSPVSIQLSVDGSFEDLDEVHALVLFRLVQEAVTNIARHSQATRAEIRIVRVGTTSPSAEHFAIEIIDNGKGADLEQPRTGLGLIGMCERLAAVGGSLTLKSRPGRGFTVMAHIPVANEK